MANGFGITMSLWTQVVLIIVKDVSIKTWNFTDDEEFSFKTLLIILISIM